MYLRIVCNYTYSRLYSICQINKTYLHHSTNSAQNVLVKEPEMVQTVTKYKDMATAMASLIVDTKVWSFWLKTVHMHLPLCILIQTHYYYIYYLHKLCIYTHTHTYIHIQNNTHHSLFSNANTGFFPNYSHSLYSGMHNILWFILCLV